jgi:hypothetical protein
MVLACGPDTAAVGEAEKAQEASEAAKAEVSEPSLADVGQPCEQDADCKGGVCLDLSVVDDGCKGKVCTQPCEENEDCPAVAEDPDCDPVGEDERSVCLYGAWEQQFCE